MAAAGQQQPGQEPGAGEGAGAGAPAADPRRRRLASYTVRNMIYSMLIMLLVVLAWWSMTYQPDELQRRPPEVTLTATHAAEQADFPLWLPEPGEGWTPTVIWFDARVDEVATWHISFTSPEGEYVALHQAADVTQEWEDEVLTGAGATGEQVELPTPNGTEVWAEWAGAEDSNAERAYLLGPEQTGGSTVVVHGTAEPAEFEAFLASVTARD